MNLRFTGILAISLIAALGLAGCHCGPTQTAKAKPAAPAATTSAAEPDVDHLFDGRSLDGWRVTDFAGKGQVEVKNGELILNEAVMTGVNYTNPVPTVNFEINLDACRRSGSDFFCGLTFPVQKSHCTFIVGGWGGGTVGISSIDSMDASENDTTAFLSFENGKWYHIRVRVTATKIEAWIDDKQTANVDYRDKVISLRPGEIEESKPLGIATWATTGVLKNITLTHLPAAK
ncbi:MAG: DUF1080 domain-containing protein [Verrucomicrobiota bacterium]